MRTAAEVREELAALELAEREALNERRKTTKVLYRFTLVPDGQNYRAREVWDDTCLVYTLRGDVLNEDECREVGIVARGGSGSYLWNAGTQRIVTALGGGTFFIPTWNADPRPCVAELGAFLAANPDGGDVTAILERHRP